MSNDYRTGVDGGVLRGTIRSFDAEQRQFTVDCGEDAVEVFDEDQLQDFFLAAPAGDNETTTTATELWCVIDRQGSQFSGKIVKVEHETLWLECPGIREPIGLPLATVKSISPMRPLAKSADTADCPARRAGWRWQAW